MLLVILTFLWLNIRFISISQHQHGAIRDVHRTIRLPVILSTSRNTTLRTAHDPIQHASQPLLITTPRKHPLTCPLSQTHSISAAAADTIDIARIPQYLLPRRSQHHVLDLDDPSTLAPPGPDAALSGRHDRATFSAVLVFWEELLGLRPVLWDLPSRLRWQLLGGETAEDVAKLKMQLRGVLGIRRALVCVGKDLVGKRSRAQVILGTYRYLRRILVWLLKHHLPAMLWIIRHNNLRIIKTAI